MADQQLALVGAESTTPTVFERSSRAARDLLTRPGLPATAKVEAILKDAALHEEIKALAPILEAAIQPAGQDFLRQALARLATVYGTPWEDERVGEIALLEYDETLGKMPADAITKGISDLKKKADLRLFPRPGQLFEAMTPHATRLQAAAWIAKTAASRQAKVAKKQTPEERAADRERLIAEGIMTPDGKMNLTPKAIPPAARSTGETRAQMAERARRVAADLEARKAAPPAGEIIV